jgi:hypothetical protein
MHVSGTFQSTRLSHDAMTWTSTTGPAVACSESVACPASKLQPCVMIHSESAVHTACQAKSPTSRDSDEQSVGQSPSGCTAWAGVAFLANRLSSASGPTLSTELKANEQLVHLEQSPISENARWLLSLALFCYHWLSLLGALQRHPSLSRDSSSPPGGRETGGTNCRSTFSTHCAADGN